jgi:GT2 family glycosyltransferase
LIDIAVLLTCFNRSVQTLACLDALSNQAINIEVKLQIYLVDDGSTDGTSEAVKKAYPSVHVIQGNGNLFWTGGMRLAYSEASQQHHDYYLWLNDDTILFPNALNVLLTSALTLSKDNTSKSIIVGSTQDQETGKLTYGGLIRKSWLSPCKFNWVEPAGDELKICDTMNGNCVLVSNQVIETIGDLDPKFSHYAADYDYGLRATKAGCSVYVASGYVGTCPYNEHKSRMKNLGLKEQLQQLQHPKGLAAEDVTLHPFWEWKEFTKRHAGFLWPVYWLIPYRRIFGLYLANQFRKT